MSFKKLKEFIEIAKNEGVSNLKYESKEEKFSVSFSNEGGIVLQRPLPSQTDSAMVSVNTNNNTDSNFHEITSPFVGTFYAQSSPNDPAYVHVGSKISKGQTLCILEAMKIMNEIESDISGEIVEVCVENESLVEFGQVLFKVRT